MGKKESNPKPPHISKKPPPPPAPPLNRHIRSTFTEILVGPQRTGECPKCESTMVRKYVFFGKKKCIHPKCGYEKNNTEIKMGVYSSKVINSDNPFEHPTHKVEVFDIKNGYVNYRHFPKGGMFQNESMTIKMFLCIYTA